MRKNVAIVILIFLCLILLCSCLDNESDSKQNNQQTDNSSKTEMKTVELTSENYTEYFEFEQEIVSLYLLDREETGSLNGKREKLYDFLLFLNLKIVVKADVVQCNDVIFTLSKPSYNENYYSSFSGQSYYSLSINNGEVTKKCNVTLKSLYVFPSVDMEQFLYHIGAVQGSITIKI